MNTLKGTSNGSLVFIVTEERPRPETRKAAYVEAERLEKETNYEYIVRWFPDVSQYVVERLPMVIPDKQWDYDKSICPPKRHPNLELTPSRTTTLDRLVLDVRNLKMLQWITATDRPRNPQQYIKDLQPALDKLYGRGHFFVSRHGNVISVQCRYPLD